MISAEDSIREDKESVFSSSHKSERNQRRSFSLNFSDLWDKSKNDLKTKMPEPFFNSFIRNLSIEISESDDTTLTLYAEKETIPHIQNKYIDAIQDSLVLQGFKGQISLLERNRKANSETETSHEIAEKNAFIPHPENENTVEMLKTNFLPHHTVFLTGSSGTGKTHLAKLLNDLFISKNQSSRYISLEDFILEMGASIRNKNTDRWKSELKALDFLFVDDFQFIKKTALHSQEEIRKLIDSYASEGKKLFLISDTSPEDLPLREDLFSRIQSGHILPILSPDQKGRCEILKKECALYGMTLTDNELRIISSRIRKDIRKLKSVPLRLLHKKTTGEIYPHLEDLFDPGYDIEPALILQTVADHFQISADAVTGPARDQKFSIPRQITAHLCMEMLNITLSEVAELLKRKDHSSVIHFRKNLEKKIKTDLFLYREIQQIRLKIEKSAWMNP